MVDVRPSLGSVTRAGKVLERNPNRRGPSRMKQQDLDSFHTDYHFFPPGARFHLLSNGGMPNSKGRC